MREKLKKWRLSLGFTQKEMAQYLGYTERGYQKNEAGEQEVSQRIIRRMETEFRK